MNCRAAVFAALLTAELVLAASANATARNSQHRSHSSSHQTAAQPPARVACTALGCRPIPAACMPVPGRTWSNLPTGYDVIVCPPAYRR